MIETREPVVTEAIALIDKALAEMLRRETGAVPFMAIAMNAPRTVLVGRHSH